MKEKPHKVLLIGWDAADWNVARPLIEQGKMPALKRLMDEGVSGNLATIRPILSPMLWTSIATGKRAWKHGIHGFSEPNQQGTGVQPITNLSRKSKAVWNIFNQQGWRSNVIGWWPSSPAEPINGVMVSNHFQQVSTNLGDPWHLRPGTVHPAHLAEPLKEMRVHPAELSNEAMLPFIPNAAKVDQSTDKRMESCAKIIAEVSSIHAAATASIQLEPWDFMAVYYDGIDHFGHGFMKFHPPRQDWVTESEFHLYKDVIEAGYRYHDMMLDTLLQLAGDDTTVMLISDHGFEPGDLRPQVLPNEPAGPAAEHSPFGMFCLRGPGIKQGETIHGANLLDIAPTLLHLYGLSVGKDMDGKVLVNCFEEPQKVQYLDSWETVEGEDGQHPKNTQLDVAESRESIKQLVDLGYIDEPDSDVTTAIDETVRELRYNLAQAYMDGGLYADAADVLEKLWERWPDLSRFGTKLLSCHLAQEDAALSRSVFERLKERKTLAQQRAKDALVHFKEAISKRQAKEQSQATEAGKDYTPAPPTRAESQKLSRLTSQAGINPHAFAYFEGSVLLLEKQVDAAIRTLLTAEAVQKANKPSLYIKLGDAHTKLKQWSEAEAYYGKALNLAPNEAHARIGLANVQLAQNNFFHAAAEALAAIELTYDNPRAHTLYGTALLALNKFKIAEQALLTAVSLNSTYPAAHRRLAKLYAAGPLQDTSKAHQHEQLAERCYDALKKRRYEAQVEGQGEVHSFPCIEARAARLNHLSNVPLIIVSGLPRSGTSLMMQMLEAGGISILSDATRQADDSNPKGYYEDARVKQLRDGQEHSWLSTAAGKAIKIIAPLLTSIPQNLPVKVIFMQRDAEEVIASQRTMLNRDSKTGAASSDSSLSQVFAQHLELCNRWTSQNEHVEILPIDYRNAVEQPAKIAQQIADFLNIPVNLEAMTAVVDADLYRERSIIS